MLKFIKRLFGWHRPKWTKAQMIEFIKADPEVQQVIRRIANG
jgi:hypothetical protein